jgi:hypothetical protein
MLLCTTMVMGLLPLSMHLCCEQQCCETHSEQASCCSAPGEKKPALPKDDCCQDQSFFNLAPVFAPVKIGCEMQVQEKETPEPYQTLVLIEKPPCAEPRGFVKTRAPERHRRHLVQRVLII